MFWRRARRQVEPIRPTIQINLSQAAQLAALTATTPRQAVALEQLTRQLAEVRAQLERQPESQPGRFRQWLDSWRPSDKTPDEEAAENERWWFEVYVPSKMGTWLRRVENYLKLYPNATREEAELKSTPFVKNQAQTEYDKLNQELDKGLARSNVITASTGMITALVVGLVAIVSTQKVVLNWPMLLGASALVIVSFVLNVWSMRPSFRRAISQPYIMVADWSVLVVDEVTDWAMVTFSCESRQKIATRYKLFHSISISVFTVGVMMLAPGFTWTYIVKFAASLF